MDSDFSQQELLRYSQQIALPQVGIEGQRKLKQSSVLIVGIGGLGSVSSLYLAAAGVGRIGLVDHDRVEVSNLTRQVLYDSGAVGELKAEAAKQRLSALNPHCQIEAYPVTFSSENAETIAGGYDILVDGTDNLPTRYLINVCCVLTERPFIYGAIDRFEGQVAHFDSRTGPCYRCAFGDPPENAHPAFSGSGVFGVLAGMVGLLQAAETLKLLLGMGESLSGKLLLVNSLDFSLDLVELQKDKDCILCGQHPEINQLTDLSVRGC
jgi:molybdopterin/thiamine biosynthesis adenylyltransferase